MNKIEARLKVLKIIDHETDIIKYAIDRRNYWKKVLKKLDDGQPMPMHRVAGGR